MDAPDDRLVDHIDGNPLNNQRGNLRLATDQTNIENRTRLNRNNKSGYRGVCWSGTMGKWRATVMHYRKQIPAGYFDTPEEANLAAIALRTKLGFATNVPR